MTQQVKHSVQSSGGHSSSNSNYQGSLQPRGFPPLPAGWVSDWETFPSSDGKLQLYSVIHHPPAAEWKSPRVLVIMHGIGEHGGRYLHVPHYMRSVVDAVYTLDHRGHGRSEGLRGHVDRFDDLVDDAVLAISRLEENIRKRFGHAEIHLLGHSLGGLIVLRTVLKNPTLPVLSVTASAPGLALGFKVNPVEKAAAKVLSSVWGSVHMNSGLNANHICRDPEVVSAYLSDRLVHSKITPRFFIEFQNARADTLKRNAEFKHPLQFLVPMEDKLVDSDTTLQYFRDLKLRDKALKTYPGFYHEPLNEPGKEQVFEDLAVWIKTHTPKSPHGTGSSG